MPIRNLLFILKIFFDNNYKEIFYLRNNLSRQGQPNYT